jgi:DNA-binding MarR family transcriptional regulator
MQSNLICLHLVTARRYNPLMAPRQASADLGGARPGDARPAGAPGGVSLAEPGLAETGGGGAGPGWASARDVGPAEADGLPPLVTAWRSLAARHAAVSAALEHELGERHGLGVSEFEVLERLAENEQHKFRVQELADAVHLSQSTLSRLIGRLEQHGLVQRNMCDVDRRGIDVCLTDAGRQRHAEAVPTHRAVIAATMPPGSGGIRGS